MQRVRVEDVASGAYLRLPPPDDFLACAKSEPATDLTAGDFDVRVDGNTIDAQGLAGKPAPDTGQVRLLENLLSTADGMAEICFGRWLPFSIAPNCDYG